MNMNDAMCAIRFKGTEMSLAHYGVKGQKKGERRWQNEDGSLTPEGKIHYGVGDGSEKNEKYTDEMARSDLNKNLVKGLTRSLVTNVVGRSMRYLGGMTAFYANSPKIRMAAGLISSLGKGLVYGSRFTAAANVGAYFLGNAVVNKTAGTTNKNKG